jgi:hypothetical protein
MVRPSGVTVAAGHAAERADLIAYSQKATR